ncbi:MULTISPECIES: M48 family metallopeptidase [unclassified Duganella]|uniref:M48 family metallopeptidase n=1 Tax=unclassified Duganella TaxID=2636909 RepID=UPI000E356F09|nr:MULTISPECIES: M48 family metallopeptidase [unclassified Duganella]RFP10127.1 peptidase M48 [Duganella sp. BJB475]RFP25567.1 peptidase M48 [Duganella sp. BJB476]
MRSLDIIKRDLLKALGRAALALFAVPLIVLAFAHYVLGAQDANFIEAVQQKLTQSADATLDKGALLTYYREHPPSSVCGDAAPERADYRHGVCEPLSEEWQFYWAQLAAVGLLVAGAVLLLTAAGLGLLAFYNRAAQYASLVLGWRIMALASALEVTLQSALLVWMSFWLTAYFLHFYSIKLVGIVALLAAGAVFASLKHMFQRVPEQTGVDGELLAADAAPALWARVRALAATLGTAPPEQIVAGIDNNFFVTEAALSVGGRKLTGRTLFVSLPLLRVMAQDEADAVLVHELAHLRGGDTSSSAALGPKLSQFDYYRAMMGAAGLTVIAFYLLSLYRFIYELALKRDSREREFLADRAARDLVSGAALVRALIKVSAYSNYRGRIERELFERNAQHGATLGIAAHVAQGLEAFAHSDEFAGDMADTDMPHPFDSHPKLDERMDNAGCVIAPQDFGAIVVAPVARSWVADIAGAEEIETRLWNVYEGRFASEHERDLAYRYQPHNDEERAVVLRHFPQQVFELNGGQRFQIGYDGLTLPQDGQFIAWDAIGDLRYKDGIGGDVLTIKRNFGSDDKVKLKGIRGERERVKAVLGHYWHRHKVSRSAG